MGNGDWALGIGHWALLAEEFQIKYIIFTSIEFLWRLS